MTAEEFATEYDNMRMPKGVSYQKEIGELMVDFAKYHVQEALKQASEKATTLPTDIMTDFQYTVGTVPSGYETYESVNKDSILNAYDINQII